MPFLIALVLSVTFTGCLGQDLVATCSVEPNSNNDGLNDDVYGTVTFTQPPGNGSEVTIDIELDGFDTNDVNTLHGFHIHEFGDLTDGCESTGSHFNPDGNDHGGPEDINRHAGDFGNIEENGDGTVTTSLIDDYISLDPDSDYSVIGLAVVIHQSADDLGESGDPAGNAGRRIACCVIG